MLPRGENSAVNSNIIAHLFVKYLLTVDGGFPSSRRCKVCGALNGNLTLLGSEAGLGLPCTSQARFPRGLHPQGQRF